MRRHLAVRLERPRLRQLFAPSPGIVPGRYQVRTARRNLVESTGFSEKLAETLRRYQNRAYSCRTAGGTSSSTGTPKTG